MPRDPDIAVTQSVVDRLIDLDPKNPAEGVATRAQSVRNLKAALRRDLEWLLNTRRITNPLVEASDQLRNSLINYGLPDVSHYTVNSARDMNRLAWLIEGAISTFEPRLRGVRVTMQPAGDNNRQLRFTVDGVLELEPAPERVSFDTMVELSSGTYQVRGEGGA